MQLRNNTRSALWWNCQAQAAKSIRIKLGISNFSPYFGEISQTLPCIKLSIVCQNPSPYLTPKISTLFYFLLFFSFSHLSSPSSRKIFLSLSSASSHQRKEASHWFSKHWANSCKLQGGLWTEEDEIELDADNATGDRAVNEEDPKLKNPNFTDEIGKKQPNLTPNFSSQRWVS